MTTASALVTINVGGGGLQAPPQAAAVGYTRLAYREEFDDTSGIDMANTGADGFNLYRVNPFGNGVLSTNDFSVNNSVLTLGPRTTDHAYGMTSCHSNGSGGAWGNGLFTGGGYFEIRTRWDPNASHAGKPWPNWWSFSVDHFYHEGDSSTYPTLELDFFEFDGPINSLDLSMFCWTGPSSYIKIEQYDLYPGTDFNSFNTIGFLWVPGDRMSRYYNDALRHTALYSDHTSPGMGWSDDQLMAFRVEACDTQPQYIDWIRVWQTP
jgi:hypothetical protein